MKKLFTAVVLVIIIGAFLPSSALCAQQGRVSVSSDGKHHWLFPKHPRLRRVTKAVGFGAVTGGIIGPIVGAGVVGGAAVGAAEHGTIRGVKDHHDMKKHGHLDHHIW